MCSSSMVETPGFTAAFTASCTWRKTIPLRRIFSNSACDLQLIIRCLRRSSAFHGTENLLHDLLYRLSAIHPDEDRKSTRLNSSHANISYAVFCLKKKNK